MSKIIIELSELSSDIPKNIRVTNVKVDGKLVCSVPLDVENLARYTEVLLDEMDIENTEVRVK